MAVLQQELEPAPQELLPLPAHSVPPPVAKEHADLNAARTIFHLATELKPLPTLAELSTGGLGKFMTDHMMVASYDPVWGWSPAEIKPYGPISFMPASSCLQYATNAWEGMKAFRGPDGIPRLFRPEKNMARFARSAARFALPAFNTEELLKIIKQLVMIERRWIPTAEGHALYIRPVIAGTHSSMSLAVSDSAVMWIMCAPAGPYFRSVRPLTLFAATDAVRAWPGGTGDHKVGVNYGPSLQPHRIAQASGYDMNLWLLGDKITEAGVMNFFVVLKRDDGGFDVLTPPLDGTILPGVTRDSVLALAAAHPSRMVLPGLSATTRLYPEERTLTMSELDRWLAEERVAEVFTVGTAVVVAPVGRIGWAGKDLILPTFGSGLGPIGGALKERLCEIQEGRFEWENWSVSCEY